MWADLRLIYISKNVFVCVFPYDEVRLLVLRGHLLVVSAGALLLPVNDRAVIHLLDWEGAAGRRGERLVDHVRVFADVLEDALPPDVLLLPLRHFVVRLLVLQPPQNSLVLHRYLQQLPLTGIPVQRLLGANSC